MVAICVDSPDEWRVDLNVAKKDILENLKSLLSLVGSEVLTFRKYHIQTFKEVSY